jgi:HIV Tat-specific factor 1
VQGWHASHAWRHSLSRWCCRWDGLTNYNIKAVETADEQEARLERYAKELEEKGRQKQAAQGQGQQEGGQGQGGGQGDVDMVQQQEAKQEV